MEKIERISKNSKEKVTATPENLKAFLRFNRVDLSKYSEAEQKAILSQLSEAVIACQKEANEENFKKLAYILVKKLGIRDEDLLDRFGNEFTPGLEENDKQEKQSPEKESLEQKDENSDEKEESLKDIGADLGKISLKLCKEVGKFFGKLGNVIFTAVKGTIQKAVEKSNEMRKAKENTKTQGIPKQEEKLEQEDILEQEDMTYAEIKEEIQALKDKIQELEKLQKNPSSKKQQDSQSKVESSKEIPEESSKQNPLNVKESLTNGLNKTVEVGKEAKKKTIKFGKEALEQTEKFGSKIYTAVKGTFQDLKEKVNKRKEARILKEDEAVQQAIDEGKIKAKELLDASKNRLDKVRVDETKINDPDREDELKIIREGSSKERYNLELSLSKENEELAAEAVKGINILRHEKLYLTLFNRYGLTGEEVLELIETAKVLENGTVVLGRKPKISMKDIIDADVKKNFEAAVHLRGIEKLKPDDAINLAKKIKVKDGKISIKGTKNLGMDAKLIAASINGEACYYDGAEKVVETLKKITSIHQLNGKMLREAHSMDLYRNCENLYSQIETMEAEMLKIHEKGTDQKIRDRLRKSQLKAIAIEKVKAIKDNGININDIIETEKSKTGKITKKAHIALSKSLSYKIKPVVDIRSEEIKSNKEDEQERG